MRRKKKGRKKCAFVYDENEEKEARESLFIYGYHGKGRRKKKE